MLRSKFNPFVTRLVVILLLLLGCATFAYSATAPRAVSKGGSAKLTAIVTPDNDFSLIKKPQGDRVNIPELVEKTILTLASDAVENWNGVLKGKPEKPSLLKMEDVLGNVFRIKAPQNRYLFVFQEKGLFGAVFYHFILFDPQTKTATQIPPKKVFGKWMDSGTKGAKLIKPFISFDDLDGDGVPEIVAEEKVHNGTMYNAIVYHYFKIAPDLSLHRILAIETRLIDLYTESSGGRIIRRVNKLTPNQVKLVTSLEVPRRKPRIVGEVTLSRDEAYSPFQVETRRVLNTRYKDLLITGSEKDENYFLKNGYDYYY